MRSHIVGIGLLLGLAATALGGPLALADDATGEEAEPFLTAASEPLTPGQELQIQGYCPDPAAGPLTSDVLTDIKILHDPKSGPPNFNASGVVAENTPPDIYQVTMGCAGQTISDTFTVVAEEQPPPEASDVVLYFNPTTARPGERILFTVACEADGARVTSPVLGAVKLESDPEGHQPWAVHGSTTVNQDAEPGDHPVSLQCGPVVIEKTLTVLRAQHGSDGRAHHGSGTGGHDGQVTRVPRGAPETGGGAPDTPAPLLAIGGLVLGAVAGAGAIAWRTIRR